MAQEPLPIESGENSVYTIILEQPGRPVVVLDHELIQRLEAAIDAIPADARGVVLASASERVFVAGADLVSIRDWPDDRLHKYLEYGAMVFGKLASLPCPTAAAINGAALGGGLELAMHCDGLLASPSPSGKPYPVGLPEAGLSICPGWGGTNLLPARMDAETAITLTAQGKPMTFDEACLERLFDRVIDDPGRLREAAAEWVYRQPMRGTAGRDGAPFRWIGRSASHAPVLSGLDAARGDLPDTPSAQAVIEAVDVGLAKGWEAGIQTERDRLVHLRGTEAGKAAIEAFFAKAK